MAKVMIDLLDGYFIEQDELNYTLRQRYICESKVKGKKTGEQKETVRTIGHFKNIQSCIERCAKLICIADNDGKFLDMKRYAEEAEKAFRKVYEVAKDEIHG